MSSRKNEHLQWRLKTMFNGFFLVTRAQTHQPLSDRAQ